MLKALIFLFLFFSIGALFYGLYHFVTSENSSVKTYHGLKYRVLFAVLTIAAIAFFLFSRDAG